MARTVRRKSKDDLLLEKERDTNIKKKSNVSRGNRKNKLRQIDYNNPSVLDELDDEYDY